jgi:predicted HicB family RNase H-like nuclease
MDNPEHKDFSIIIKCLCLKLSGTAVDNPEQKQLKRAKTEYFLRFVKHIGKIVMFHRAYFGCIFCKQINKLHGLCYNCPMKNYSQTKQVTIAPPLRSETRCMLTVSPELHYQLKVLAVSKGKKLSDITAQALRDYLAKDGG